MQMTHGVSGKMGELAGLKSANFFSRPAPFNSPDEIWQPDPIQPVMCKLRI
jgi:hypothetical protein